MNSAGNIQKNKSGVKDGNDCYYYVDKNYKVQLYTDNKDIKTAKDATVVIDKWEDIVNKRP